MKKIYEDLSRIQKELKAPKNLYNSFGKYSYRNAEGILEAVKPMLDGLAIIINDEPVMVGDRFYIKATVTLTDGDDSISATAYAREDEQKKGMDGCQVTGSCSSYARKYALNALLMIDDSKDSDDDSLSPKNPQNAPEQDEKKQTGKKQAEPQKPFSRPVNSKADVQATVTTTDKVPPVKEENPVQKRLGEELVFMGQMYGIQNKKAMFDKFMEMRASLIKAKIVPDVASDKMTMEQLENLMDAIYKNYNPSGEKAS